ncbi:uncharacterized protein UV8b_05796 [Ustilaginoidea virens]|uniref:Uncharacterized protein n=1 Tax=Ustilaginoidea virens TaxID=1159556 RepID=A0A8E5HU45_USTVR|nr:uncharacterized protein UV8b_05796 [Ustilaginoidea virens]QUC21553.1 hypothetical protein UV8b_05796 [Ustilaginoidea virens]
MPACLPACIARRHVILLVACRLHSLGTRDKRQAYPEATSILRPPFTLSSWKMQSVVVLAAALLATTLAITYQRLPLYRCILGSLEQGPVDYDSITSDCDGREPTEITPYGASLIADQDQGSTALYRCTLSTSYFLDSTDSNCENNINAYRRIFLGYIYTSQVADSTALYRCVSKYGATFQSLDSGCEGGSTEGRTTLGYLLLDVQVPYCDEI